MSKRVLCLIAVIVATVGVWPVNRHISTLQPLALANPSQNVTVEQVAIRGNRRIPESTVKIWIGTREGDPYNPAQLDRDVRALYAQGHFEDVKVFAEEGARGGKVITFEVKRATAASRHQVRRFEIGSAVNLARRVPQTLGRLVQRIAVRPCQSPSRRSRHQRDACQRRPPRSKGRTRLSRIYHQRRSG